MDEGLLNDLLECSVCLERLDTSSRVLPCQHTFCLKCLKVIVESHKELRCPECRVLVEAKVEELPPNVLLMRILEGMRNNAPRKLHAPRPRGHAQGQAQQSGQSRDGKPLPPHGRALHDFISKEPGDLSFKKGDTILLQKKLDAFWYQGETSGRTGVFPITYLQVVIPLPVATALCKALYDFRMSAPDEEGCLAFDKGAIITVHRRVDDNWAEGRLEGRVGIFPIAFVELNQPARLLVNSAPLNRPVPPLPDHARAGHSDHRHAQHTHRYQPMSMSTPTTVQGNYQNMAAMSQSHPNYAHPQTQIVVPPATQHVTISHGLVTAPRTIIEPQTKHSLDLIHFTNMHNKSQGTMGIQSVSRIGESFDRLRSVKYDTYNSTPVHKTDTYQNVRTHEHFPVSVANFTNVSSDSSSSVNTASVLSSTTTPNTSSNTSTCESAEPSLPSSPDNNTERNATVIASNTTQNPTEETNENPESSLNASMGVLSLNESSTATNTSLNVSLPPAESPKLNASANSNCTQNHNDSQEGASNNESSRLEAPSSSKVVGRSSGPDSLLNFGLGLQAALSPSHGKEGYLVARTHRDHHHREKRHSLTPSSHLQGSHTTQNRHSAEILATSLLDAGPERRRRRSRSGERPLPAAYVALYPYKPQKPDELELKKGGVYVVTERCRDGWYKGRSERSQRCGVFPGNYVARPKHDKTQQPAPALKPLAPAAPAPPDAPPRAHSPVAPGMPHTSNTLVQQPAPALKPLAPAAPAPPDAPPRAHSPVAPGMPHTSNTLVQQPAPALKPLAPAAPAPPDAPPRAHSPVAPGMPHTSNTLVQQPAPALKPLAPAAPAPPDAPPRAHSPVAPGMPHTSNTLVQQPAPALKPLAPAAPAPPDAPPRAHSPVAPGMPHTSNTLVQQPAPALKPLAPAAPAPPDAPPRAHSPVAPGMPHTSNTLVQQPAPALKPLAPAAPAPPDAPPRAHSPVAPGMPHTSNTLVQQPAPALKPLAPAAPAPPDAPPRAHSPVAPGMPHTSNTLVQQPAPALKPLAPAAPAPPDAPPRAHSPVAPGMPHTSNTLVQQPAPALKPLAPAAPAPPDAPPRAHSPVAPGMPHTSNTLVQQPAPALKPLAPAAPAPPDAPPRAHSPVAPGMPHTSNTLVQQPAPALKPLAPAAPAPPDAPPRAHSPVAPGMPHTSNTLVQQPAPALKPLAPAAPAPPDAPPRAHSPVAPGMPHTSNTLVQQPAPALKPLAPAAPAPPDAPPRAHSPVAPGMPHTSNTLVQQPAPALKPLAPAAPAPPDAPPRAHSPVAPAQPLSYPWGSGVQTQHSTPKSEKSKEKCKPEKSISTGVSLMKRLAAMKKCKSPPPAGYSMDNPVFEDTPGSSLMLLPSQHHPVHVRSGSCPSQLLRALPGERRAKDRTPAHDLRTHSRVTAEGPWQSQHRKSQSLDVTAARRERHHSQPVKERFRCIVPYPPNSEYELELKVDDIVVVSKKRGDGWYKGTLQRTGRTGLFPASFVQSCPD